jgi:hypothetical protein
MPQIQIGLPDPGGTQGQHDQPQDLGVALDPGVPVDLGADLQGAARTGESVAAGMQNGAEITEPCRGVASEMVCIDPSDLRGHVGTHAEQPTAELVGELEGLKIEILTGPGQKRLEIVDEGRDDELVAPARVEIQQLAPQVSMTCACGGSTSSIPAGSSQRSSFMRSSPGSSVSIAPRGRSPR